MMKDMKRVHPLSVLVSLLICGGVIQQAKADSDAVPSDASTRAGTVLNSADTDIIKTKVAENNTAIHEKDDAKRDLDRAIRKSHQTEKEVDQSTQILETSPAEIQKNQDDIKELLDAETRIKLDIVTKERKLDAVKRQADQDVIRRTQLAANRKAVQGVIDTDTADRDRIMKAVKSLEKHLADGFPYPLTFNSSPEWNDLFKAYMKESTDHADPSHELLAKLIEAEKRLPETEYTAPQEDEDIQYDVTQISDLPDDIWMDLNQYFVSLLNTTQGDLGFTQGVNVNTNTMKLAKDIAKEYEKEGYTRDGHFGRGINTVSRRWNLSTSAAPGEDTAVQYLENLIADFSWAEYEGNHVSKARLYETIHDWLHRFFHEGQTAGHYAHAVSLVQAKTLGLSFSYVDGILRLHAISVDDARLDEAGEDHWRSTFSKDSTATLPVKDFSRKDVDISHLNMLRSQVAELDKIIQTNQDKVDAFTRDIKAIDDAKDEVTKASDDLNRSRDDLSAIARKKIATLKLERKLTAPVLENRLKAPQKDLLEGGTDLPVPQKTSANYQHAPKGLNSSKQGWVKEGKTWYYYKNGQTVKNIWQGAYYLKSDGKMAENEWIYDSSYRAWYYLRADGSYAHDAWQGDYYLKSDGKMATDEWIYDPHYQSWFYLGEDGAYVNNQWKKIKGMWYHFRSGGYMSRNTWVGDYYLKASGAMAMNEWIYDSSYRAWYYLKANGAYARNEVFQGYRFDASGKWT